MKHSGAGVPMTGPGNFGKLCQYSKAIEFQTKYLNISRELGDRAAESRAYGNVGRSFHCLGQYSKAIEFHTKFLNISRELRGRVSEGAAYGNLGTSFANIGQYSKAVEYHTKHLFPVSWGTELGKAWRMATWVMCSVDLVNTTRRSSSAPRN